MNKSAIKNFAIWARNKLIADISYKAGLLGITDKEVKSPLPQSTKDAQFFDIGSREPYQITGKDTIEKRKLLAARIMERAQQSDYKTAYKTVIEEVAYTWFNRLVAVRFMEVNDYLPSRIRVLSSATGKTEPDIVTTPFDTDWEFKAAEREYIIACKTDNKLDELFRTLFIKQCNALNAILPELFEKDIADYYELLLNISFTDKEGVVWHLINDIAEEDFKEAVEIIGWMYQYYNTEPKQAVFDGLKKNIKISKENIPAATQLFTPNWIVCYMVENSLGRLWLEGHPNDALKSNWKYYLEEAEQTTEVQAQLDKIRVKNRSLSPEDITFIDPCMGSGHILVYAFDVFMQIYESAGYSQRDAACLILEKNIYGLEIDKRAYQLAYFALYMKGRQYNRRIFDCPSALQVYHPVGWADGEEYGSLIITQNIDATPEQFLPDGKHHNPNYKKELRIWNFKRLLAQRYDVVCTNPPYMGKKSLNSHISDYLSKNYPSGKTELYAAFIIKCHSLVKISCYMSLITIHTWMFINSYEKLRGEILSSSIISTMVHSGASTFEELNAFNVLVTAFTIRKSLVHMYVSIFIRLADYYNSAEKQKNYHNPENEYLLNKEELRIIPGMPIVYWMSEKVRDVFTKAQSIGYYSEPKVGLQTADNERFVRYWHEVFITKCGFSVNKDESTSCGKKWFPYNKGGYFRKWYGMNEYVVNWENGGFEIKNFTENGYQRSVLRNTQYYFRPGITWSLFGFENFGVRYKNQGFIFDVSGSSMFPKDDLIYYVLAFLASNVSFMYLKMLAPTVNFQVGNIGDLPLLINKPSIPQVDKLAKENIEMSRIDWDAFETSWDFKMHPLV